MFITKENHKTDINFSKAGNVVYINKSLETYYSKPCIICDESVRLSNEEEELLKRGLTVGSKICDKCKQAILYIRNQIQ